MKRWLKTCSISTFGSDLNASSLFMQLEVIYNYALVELNVEL
jgi:hypothetical protein